MILIEGESQAQGMAKIANMVLLTWKPYLSGACGVPEDSWPNRIFASIPTGQTGSFLMACTESGNFKDAEVAKNIYVDIGDFPPRAVPDGAFKATKEEQFILSLKEQVERVEGILERTRAQMHPSRRFLKKIGVIQGRFGSYSRIRKGMNKLKDIKHFGHNNRGIWGESDSLSRNIWINKLGSRPGLRTLRNEAEPSFDRRKEGKVGAPVRRKTNVGAFRSKSSNSRWLPMEIMGLKLLHSAIDRLWELGKTNVFNLFIFSEKMTLFNLHLFSGVTSQWDRLYGADGGVAYRKEEARLSAFLDAFRPESPEDLNGVALSLMKPKALELNPELKPVKLDRMPDVSYPSNGFRAIWEQSSARKMKDFKSGLRIHLREKIGNSKTLTMKMEDAPCNGDRIVEILVSLPQTLEECVVVGHAKQAIMHSNRLQAAPKWMQHYVRTFDKQGSEVPGIYVSVICSKSKDTRAFQEMLFRSFPELAGGQLEEWQEGTKYVQGTEQGGSEAVHSRKAFFSRICIPLAMHYAGTGTVALDRRAPEALWLTFEDYAYKQYAPCELCQGRDGHYTFQRLERQQGVAEDILLCPHKGTCPHCGKGQAAFLYGGHLAECSRKNPICEDCRQAGYPAEHKPMDPIRCRSYMIKEDEEYNVKRLHQASVNKAFESLLARAIATKGKDFQPYLACRRKASSSKACLNEFYRVHEELGDFQDQLRALAPGEFGFITRNLSKAANQDNRRYPDLIGFTLSREVGKVRLTRTRGGIGSCSLKRAKDVSLYDIYYRFPGEMSNGGQETSGTPCLKSIHSGCVSCSRKKSRS